MKIFHKTMSMLKVVCNDEPTTLVGLLKATGV